MISSNSPLTEISESPDVGRFVYLSVVELVVVVDDLMLDFLEIDEPDWECSRLNMDGRNIDNGNDT